MTKQRYSVSEGMNSEMTVKGHKITTPRSQKQKHSRSPFFYPYRHDVYKCPISFDILKCSIIKHHVDPQIQKLI